MFQQLPESAHSAFEWDWSKFEPYTQDLLKRDLTAATLDGWMKDWSRLAALLREVENRLYNATSTNTADEQAEALLSNYFENIKPQWKNVNNQLNLKLVDSNLEPTNFAVPLRNIRAQIDLFAETNLPLLAEESKLGTEYSKIIGAQTVMWEGEEKTLVQLTPIFQDADRAKREKAWRMAGERRMQDRDAVATVWAKMMNLRKQIAKNADCKDYREYKWREYLRFDYTPADAETFQRAIESVVVPVAERIYAKRQQRLHLDKLRPWDLDVDISGKPPLRPYKALDELVNRSETMFRQLDPQLGDYLKIMRDENLLDLDNRKGKGPGAYCINYDYMHRPFIFANSVGIHDDIQTMLHEGGHAFHVFETTHLPYYQQYSEESLPIEFAEVASMGMELLAAPYLTTDKGGFYTQADAARARIEHLEGVILFWPYMATVDALQHWIYTHHDEATDLTACDAKWTELWHRFMKGVDFSGLETYIPTRWHRQSHIFTVPFYYIEYGLAQLGAVQVWANSLHDQRAALTAYRKALSLGGTATLTELFTTAGVKFAFDAATLGGAVTLIEHTLNELHQIIN